MTRFIIGLALAGAAIIPPVQADEIKTTAVDRFLHLCGAGGKSKGVETLPGKDIAKEDAPKYFRNDLARAGKNYRLTETDGEYAMRAVMKSSMGAVLVKCALGTDQIKYDEALPLLAAEAGDKPSELGDEKVGRRAMIGKSDKSFQVFEEKSGWISIYRMDILFSAKGVDPKYLKKGAKPRRLPEAK